MLASTSMNTSNYRFFLPVQELKDQFLSKFCRKQQVNSTKLLQYNSSYQVRVNNIPFMQPPYLVLQI